MVDQESDFVLKGAADFKLVESKEENELSKLSKTLEEQFHKIINTNNSTNNYVIYGGTVNDLSTISDLTVTRKRSAQGTIQKLASTPHVIGAAPVSSNIGGALVINYPQTLLRAAHAVEYTKKEKWELSTFASKLAEYVKTNDIESIATISRTSNVVINTAVMTGLAIWAAKTNNLIGSSFDRFFKGWLYMLSCVVPLRNSSIFRNATWQPTTNVFEDERWPYSVAAAGAVVIEARAISLERFYNVISGKMVIQDFEMEEWGNTVAVVPVQSNNYLSRSELIAYSLLFMEYPFCRTHTRNTHYNHANGVTDNTDTRYITRRASNNVYITGPRDRILFVMLSPITQGETLGFGLADIVINDANVLDVGGDVNQHFQLATPAARGLQMMRVMQYCEKIFGRGPAYRDAYLAAAEYSVHILDPTQRFYTDGATYISQRFGDRTAINLFNNANLTLDMTDQNVVNANATSFYRLTTPLGVVWSPVASRTPGLFIPPPNWVIDVFSVLDIIQPVADACPVTFLNKYGFQNLDNLAVLMCLYGDLINLITERTTFSVFPAANTLVEAPNLATFINKFMPRSFNNSKKLNIAHTSSSMKSKVFCCCQVNDVTWMKDRTLRAYSHFTEAGGVIGIAAVDNVFVRAPLGCWASYADLQVDDKLDLHNAGTDIGTAPKYGNWNRIGRTIDLSKTRHNNTKISLALKNESLTYAGTIVAAVKIWNQLNAVAHSSFIVEPDVQFAANRITGANTLELSIVTRDQFIISECLNKIPLSDSFLTYRYILKVYTPFNFLKSQASFVDAQHTSYISSKFENVYLEDVTPAEEETGFF